MARDEIGGNWYGMMVSTPHWGPINVSFEGKGASYTGQWDFPDVDGDKAKHGQFKAVRFAHWLYVRITTAPLRGAELRLTLLGSRGKSMLFGAIPLGDAEFPFATVTLFRIRPGEREMDGLCPIRPKQTKA